MAFQSYQDLDVWQVTTSLVEHCYMATRTFPKDELYGLASQVRRAAVSIPANIAEGYGRELETHLLIARRLDMLSDEAVVRLQSECERVSTMLRALIRSLELRKDQQN